MRYAQHKSGQKLHIVYEIEDSFSQPVCGRKFDSFRATFNLPMGNSCKKCRQRFESKSFDEHKFIKEHFN